MVKIFKCLLTFILIAAGAIAGMAMVGDADSPNASRHRDHLQNISVLVSRSNGHGSGTIVRKSGEDIYILTAFHVIENTMNNDGTFQNIEVSQFHIENGVNVGVNLFDAEVIRYARNLDIAVLHVIKKRAFADGVKFRTTDSLLPISTKVTHVGCFNGPIGYNSYSEGVISQYGRMFTGKLRMQVSCANYPGSSGGGIYDDNGKYIGMLIARHDAALGLVTPVQDLRSWAWRADLAWLFNNGDYSPSVPLIKRSPLNIE